jgi:hypothetical protein
MSKMTVSVEGVKFDDVTRMLATQVQAGIEKIEAANEILLNAEGGTGDRDIDKLFKDNKVEDKDAVSTWAKAEKARETYRKLVTDARNLYRKNVLGEEEKSDSEIDKDAVKDIRKTVMASLSLIKDFANANGLSDVVTWADSVSVPQVGRQGSSGVSGAKKPRARVSFNGNTYESFGEAAKALSTVLSTDDNKVDVGSSDLVQAWSDAGETENFSYRDITFTVALKNTEKAA